MKHRHATQRQGKTLHSNRAGGELEGDEMPTELQPRLLSESPGFQPCVNTSSAAVTGVLELLITPSRAIRVQHCRLEFDVSLRRFPSRPQHFRALHRYVRFGPCVHIMGWRFLRLCRHDFLLRRQLWTLAQWSFLFPSTCRCFSIRHIYVKCVCLGSHSIRLSTNVKTLVGPLRRLRTSQCPHGVNSLKRQVRAVIGASPQHLRPRGLRNHESLQKHIYCFCNYVCCSPWFV